MATFFGFDPFEDLLNMQRQMDSLLNAFGTPTTTAATTLPPLLTTGAATTPADVGGGRRLATTGAKQPRSWSPILDVCETDKSLVVHAELPGCSKEDIKLSIDNDRLVLQGKKRAHKKEKGENWVRRERFRGSFYRSLPLPRNVDVGGIEASYDNGILEIVVPKSQAHAKRQTIDIKSTQGVTTQPQEQDKIQQRETTLPQPQEKEEEKRQWPQQEQRAQGGMPEGVQQPQQMQEQQRSETKPEQFQQPLQEQQRFDVQPEGQQQQEQQRSDVKFEGVQPPLPPPLPPQEQKVELPTQEQQKPFAPEEKTEPEQLKPFEEKPVEDIKQFQGEQQTEQKDQQQLAKLQEESTQSSSIFIQGGESGQVSQEREKGSVQAM